MNSSHFSRFASSVLSLLVFALPLVFTTLTPNFYTTPKQLVIIIAILSLLLFQIISLIFHRRLTIIKSPLLVPLGFFILAVFLSLVANPEARTEGFAGYGLTYLTGCLLAFYANFASSEKTAVKNFFIALVATTFLLALHSLFQLTLLTKVNLPDFMNSRAFTPTGNPLTTLVLLIIGSVAAFFYGSQKLKGFAQYLIFAAGIVTTIAAVALASLMLPGNELAPSLLPYQASWSIALDALKGLKSFFFGVGLANFSPLYTAVKPLSLNASSLWNTTPSSATSELLQLMTTMGIVGLVSFLLFPFSIFKNRPRLDKNSQILIPVFLTALFALFLAPISLPLSALFFISLGLLAPKQEVEQSLTTPLASLVALCLGFIMAIPGYYYLRFFLAELNIRQAQLAISNNDGLTVYNRSIQAVKLVPTMTSYRLSYSQVNLTLASSLSQKPDLTEADRSQITTLVSQAIREAKVATTLRPSDARTWLNLGSIYRQLINVAEGADQFALTAYQQAIALDRGNPAIRVDYGGLLFQLANIEENQDVKNTLLSQAITELTSAIQLKNDYANAYYNLSKVLEAAGNIQGAYNAMTQAVASLDPSSPDLETAKHDLSNLQAKLPQPSPTPSPNPAGPSPIDTELVAPTPLPSPLEGGPIELEESSSPAPLPSPSSTNP